ncbi:MAG TPA: filamentous hemagglutinin N-terminal domain-containing protein, partial [Rhabdochlamydiaceae bacterium]
MKKQPWIAVVTFILMGHLSANPTGGQAISGDLTFHFHGKTLEIRASDQSIVHWDDFSIDAGELTRFVQPSASATVLNKVLGLNPSLINGALEANGKVILINPQGVIVGKGGIIRTADFIASTLDRISTTAEGMEFTGDSTASIVNYGTIKTEFGDVVLIATTVNNSGSVEAPLGKVLIGAGSNVLLSPVTEERIFIRPSLSSGSIENNGVLSAAEVVLKTEGSAYALAINAGGFIQATDVVESNGKIFLVAEGGLLTVNGNLESPKGTVELRGDKVLIGGTANIDVSSDNGGGTVLIGTHHLKNDPSNVYSDMIYLDP